MKNLFICLLCIISANGIFGQAKLSGNVADESEAPLTGVTVFVKGTTNGTITDSEGNYSISSNADEGTLVFSFVGMKTQEINFEGDTTINIIMVNEAVGLDEVVAIGYGTVKRRNLTGAVASVKSSEIIQAPVASPVEAIQGRVAGLDITRNDGRANSGMSILLRGNRTIQEDREKYSHPIYIIDGIQGDINNLNPGDIVSIDVLKDASSIAIYGAAGANGVMIITTKKAEKGRIQVDFNSYVSVNSWPSFPDALQGDAWLDYLSEAFIATRGEAPADRDALLSEWRLSYAGPFIDSSKWVNWIDEALKTGIQYNNSLSVRGGTDVVQSGLSMGYNRTEGIYKNDYIDIFTMRGNLNVQASKWAKFGIITGLIFRNDESRPSRINKAFGMVPLGDVYDNNGEIIQFPLGSDHDPSILADDIDGTYKDNSKSFDITANPYAEITLAEGLTFKSVIGTSLSTDRQGIYNSDHTYMMLTGSQTAIRNASYDTKLTYNYTWENIVDYQTAIADIHHIDATFITSYANNQNEESEISSEGYLYDDFLFYNLRAGVNPTIDVSSYEVKKRMSYAGRLHYDFKGKYLFTGSVRYDGVSQLSRKWDVFPAGAIAWRISDEGFMKGTSNWLNSLKLRIGYGVSGSDNIGAYETKTEVTNGSDILNFGSGQVLTNIPTEAVGNVLLGWEKSYNLNIGLDFVFFNNRIDGSFEWYNTDTKDIIVKRKLPFSGGGFNPKTPYTLSSNIGRMNNKGIEITVNSRNIRTNDFQWYSTFTFSRNQEEIVSIDLGSTTPVDELISEGLFIGEPRHVFYDYKKTGIWQLEEEADAAVFGLEPGDVKIASTLTKRSDGVWYKTITDDEGNDSIAEFTADNPYIINSDDDRQIIGHKNPDWIAGLQNTFTYKGFDLNIFITARWGQMIQGELLGYFNYGKINIPDNYDYWTETNPTNHYPRPYLSNRHTDFSQPLGGESLTYVDASYIKVKNIILGYTLPSRLINRIGLSKLRIYGTIYNSLIFTKSHLLKGVDPETGASDSFPLYKQLVFGVNVSF